MNSTNNTVAVAGNILIDFEVYQHYVYTSLVLSTTVLCLYATLIKYSQEIEYIWSKPFSLPSLMYIITRYGTIISQGVTVALNSIPSGPGRTCNILTDIEDTVAFLTYVCVQGLLVIRAYSICQGNKILVSALGFIYFSYCSLSLYDVIAFPGCNTGLNVPEIVVTINFTIDIMAISTDMLIFGICMWNVWGTWRLKRRVQSTGCSLISVLLAQSKLRCCFVVAITFADGLITWFTNPANSFFASGFNLIQNILSATLVADFTLDLRHLNSAKIEASQMSLPSLRFSNMLQHVHQSFLVEMATPEGRNREVATESDYTC